MEFVLRRDQLILKFEFEPRPNDWVKDVLAEKGSVVIAKTFDFSSTDVVDVLSDADYYSYEFKLGELDGEYFRISASKIGTDSDVLIHKSIKLTRKHFIAYRDISIFRKIDAVVEGEVRVGGAIEGSIPQAEFESLIKRFPNSTELTRYASARIAKHVGDYFKLKSDPEKAYEKYLSARKAKDLEPSVPIVFEGELKKYIFIRDQINLMLGKSDTYSEDHWQKLMLTFILVLFPKYVAVLHEVHVQDFYSDPAGPKVRKIDLALLDASGNLDVVELKKPMDASLVSAGQYRDNYYPRRELSGTIMQVEKYIFHLNKWGVAGEREITKAQRKKGALPSDLSVKVSNPKGMIIAGRSQGLSAPQLFDFEIMKRQYSNIIDIMSYDDLLARLDRIIAKFSSAPPTSSP